MKLYAGKAGTQVLLEVINALDVNEMSDAMKAAKKVSEQNPGRVFTEVDKAEREVREAITHLLEARGCLSKAIGNLVVDADREARRNAPVAA